MQIHIILLWKLWNKNKPKLCGINLKKIPIILLLYLYWWNKKSDYKRVEYLFRTYTYPNSIHIFYFPELKLLWLPVCHSSTIVLRPYIYIKSSVTGKLCNEVIIIITLLKVFIGYHLCFAVSVYITQTHVISLYKHIFIMLVIWRCSYVCLY